MRSEPDAWSGSCQWWNHHGAPPSLLCLLKLCSYLWPKVQSRCRAACKDLQSEGAQIEKTRGGENSHLLLARHLVLGVVKARNLFPRYIKNINRSVKNERFSNPHLVTVTHVSKHKYTAEILRHQHSSMCIRSKLTGDGTETSCQEKQLSGANKGPKQVHKQMTNPTGLGNM